MDVERRVPRMRGLLLLTVSESSLDQLSAEEWPIFLTGRSVAPRMGLLLGAVQTRM